MKKPNISLSGDGIKEFFFRHGEKVFFGVAAGLIAVFFYLGWKTEVYDDTNPTDMLNTAQRADGYINDNTNWDRIADYRQANTTAADDIRNSEVRIDASKYPFENIVGTAVRTLELRKDPDFKPPIDLQTKFFKAQVVLNETSNKPAVERGGIHGSDKHEVITFPDELRYEWWVYRPQKNNVSINNEFITRDVVVGTALIPHDELKAAYENAFQFARNYDEVRDTPEYLFLEVQRKTKDSDWKSITAHVHEIVAKTAKPAPDLADENYLVENVTLKVPPFLGIDYRQIAMRLKIPARDFLAKLKEKAKKPEEDDSDPDNIFSTGNQTPDDEAETAKADDEEQKKDAPFRLVRFFDLDDKKLGESYLYRVRVWLKDPNNPDNVNNVAVSSTGASYSLGRGGGAAGGGGTSAEDDPGAGAGGGAGGSAGGQTKQEKAKPLFHTDLDATVRDRIKAGPADVPQDVVKHSEFKKVFNEDWFKQLVATDWCEAGQWVTITEGFETFVTGPVRAPTRQRAGKNSFSAGEPKAKIVAMSFQNDLGVTVPATTDVYAGSVMNFRTVANVLHPVDWTIRQIYESKDRNDKVVGRKFKTDAMVVDFLGGQRQPFSSGSDTYYAPGEVLIMDRNGNFVIRSDIDDETSFRQANFISPENTEKLAEAEKKGDKDDEGNSGRGGGRGGGGGDGGEGGGG